MEHPERRIQHPELLGQLVHFIESPGGNYPIAMAKAQIMKFKALSVNVCYPQREQLLRGHTELGAHADEVNQAIRLNANGVHPATRCAVSSAPSIVTTRFDWIFPCC